MIDEKLLSEIELKKAKIEEFPEKYEARTNKIKEWLRITGNVHSWYQENPEIRNQIIKELGVRSTKKLRKQARIGIRCLFSAWYYLVKHPSLNIEGKRFLDCLGEENIKKVAELVDPGLNSEGYRTKEVSLGFNILPPKPREVSDLVKSCLYHIKESEFRSELHPIEKAIYFHLNLGKIQPFNSGNKRTARLIQNAILDDYGYPPSIIYSGERKSYMNVFEKAILGISRENVENQKPFYDFIASKINIALDDILNYMRVGNCSKLKH